jgi:hypothetical protein
MRSKEDTLMAQKDAYLYIDKDVIDGAVGGVHDAMEEYK